jgi:hypothetical protein
MQLIHCYFIIISAVHVSSGFSAHHQELIKLCAALGTVMLSFCLPLVWMGFLHGVDGLDRRSNPSTPAVDSTILIVVRFNDFRCKFLEDADYVEMYRSLERERI